MVCGLVRDMLYKDLDRLKVGVDKDIYMQTISIRKQVNEIYFKIRIVL